MKIVLSVSDLDILYRRLTLVNAKLFSPRGDEQPALHSERRELMELIARERLGESHQLVWRPGDTMAN